MDPSEWPTEAFLVIGLILAAGVAGILFGVFTLVRRLLSRSRQKLHYSFLDSLLMAAAGTIVVGITMSVIVFLGPKLSKGTTKLAVYSVLLGVGGALAWASRKIVPRAPRSSETARRESKEE